MIENNGDQREFTLYIHLLQVPVIEKYILIMHQYDFS